MNGRLTTMSSFKPEDAELKGAKGQTALTLELMGGMSKDPREVFAGHPLQEQAAGKNFDAKAVQSLTTEFKTVEREIQDTLKYGAAVSQIGMQQGFIGKQYDQQDIPRIDLQEPLKTAQAAFDASDTSHTKATTGIRGAFGSKSSADSKQQSSYAQAFSGAFKESREFHDRIEGLVTDGKISAQTADSMHQWVSQKLDTPLMDRARGVLGNEAVKIAEYKIPERATPAPAPTVAPAEVASQQQQQSTDRTSEMREQIKTAMTTDKNRQYQTDNSIELIIKEATKQIDKNPNIQDRNKALENVLAAVYDEKNVGGAHEEKSSVFQRSSNNGKTHGLHRTENWRDAISSLVDAQAKGDLPERNLKDVLSTVNTNLQAQEAQKQENKGKAEDKASDKKVAHDPRENGHTSPKQDMESIVKGNKELSKAVDAVRDSVANPSAPPQNEGEEKAAKRQSNIAR